MVDKVTTMAAPMGTVSEGLAALDAALGAAPEIVDQDREELMSALGVRRAG